MTNKFYQLSILSIFAMLLSCTATEKSNPAQAESNFIKTANHFHTLYITAGDCEERNAMISQDILFFENRQPFTYQDILKYCDYIQPKEPFDIYSKQYLIQPKVGFDYVDQYFLNSELDTIREISSRIWELRADNWVVTKMQVSRH